ncbi:MAG: FRG domain-containing protein [Phycisphaerales bacterium]|nr:FRG domain-containing protein [Phycisphaerales bacterium]
MNSSVGSEAERIYTEYRQYGSAGWGPFIHYEDPARQARLDSEIDRVLGSAGMLLVNDRTVWLPSAWHAVLFFIRAQRYLKYTHPPQHQLYRGHANPAWPLVTTFDRLSPDDMKREWTASTLFTAYLARRLYCPTLHIASYGAVTRHMGFASNQMDWTVDPAVAVFLPHSRLAAHARERCTRSRYRTLWSADWKFGARLRSAIVSTRSSVSFFDQHRARGWHSITAFPYSSPSQIPRIPSAFGEMAMRLTFFSHIPGWRNLRNGCAKRQPKCPTQSMSLERSCGLLSRA